MPETSSNRNKILIIIIIVLVIAIIAFVVWWQFFRGKTPAANNVNANVNANSTAVNVSVNTAVNQNIDSQTKEQLDLIRLANLFTERLGSYSSQTEFQNLSELKKYMTKNMRAWADSYNKASAANVNAAGYGSIITKVLSTEIVSQSGKAAKIQQAAQRVEEGSNINGKNSYYQNIILEMAKEGDNWLVDKATWQPK